MSAKHLNRYLHEFEFRWKLYNPKERKTKKGKKKIIRRPMPMMDMLIIC